MFSGACFRSAACLAAAAFASTNFCCHPCACMAQSAFMRADMVSTVMWVVRVSGFPSHVDMGQHPDYVHVAAGTIREKVRRMIVSRRQGE